MKQRGVGENAVEISCRQIQLQKVLLPHLTTGVAARHRGKTGGAFQADRDMPQRRERTEISPRSTAEIENRKRRLAREVPQQGGDILADVVIRGARPKLARVLFVVGQGFRGNGAQGIDLWGKALWHGRMIFGPAAIR